MAKPNYSFQKRQRELEKAKKKEARAQRKAELKEEKERELNGTAESPAAEDGAEATEGTVAPDSPVS